mgnify:FL=1
MGEVIELNTITTLDIPAERVLNSALKKDLESAVVLGYDKEGHFYFASSIANGPDVLWLMEKLKLELLTIEVDR